MLAMTDNKYDSDTAQELTKRIMLSMKNRDPERFNSGVKKIRGPK